MEKQWFVLHTLTGKERKAQESIIARTKLEQMTDYVGRCEIPTEKITEKKDGKKRTKTRLVFPGYLLIELALYDNSGLDEHGGKKVYERTWQFLRETPGVIGFVGVFGDNNKQSQRKLPIPLKQSEVDAILQDKPNGGVIAERPKVNFAVEETVKIIDGAFMGLTGIVSMVDPGKGKLKVEVNIFNRKVQVDAEYWQVEKVSVTEMDQSVK